MVIFLSSRRYSLPFPRYARSSALRKRDPGNPLMMADRALAAYLESPMARVTIEDCLHIIPNQFELCQVAAKRARQLARGAMPHVPWEDHKSTVISLKEIAAGFVDRSVMAEADLPPVRSSQADLNLPELAFEI
jgi:DNA-directed RNA polymerase subunit omega